MERCHGVLNTMAHEIGERKSLRVLLLVDPSADRDRICSVLSVAGYAVKPRYANDRKDLAAALHRHDFDVILSSFSLSAFTAFDALDICADVCPEVPFICISESIGEVPAVDLVKRGAADHVLMDHLERLPNAVRCAIEEAGKGRLRQQVDLTLRQSEERYRALFNFSPDALYVHVNGVAVLVNPAFCRLLGADAPAQLIGRSVLEIVHPDFHESIRNRWKLLSNGRPAPPLEERFVRLDGTVIDVDVRAVPIDWAGSQAVQVIAHDITERKRAEAALQKTEGLYRIVFENTGTATVLIEDDTIISLANTEFEKLSQCSKQEIEGKKSWTEFVVPEDLDRMRDQHAARRDGRGAALRQYEFRFVRRDGNIRHILLTIDIIPGTKRSVASLLDISERKWAEEVVRDSEERFRMVFEHVFDGIAIYAEDADPAKRRLIECNERYAALAGRSREELLRRGRTDDLTRSLEDSANMSRIESLAGGKTFRGTFSWIRPDGEYNVIEYLGTPITWRGEPYSIGIDRDITQWKRAEERLAALAHERGTLLKEIYHRVNNNLQVVSSLLNLQARQVNDERFSDLLRESQLRVRAMALVHERLYRSHNLSSIDFGEYLQGEIGELRLAFGRIGVTLSLDAESIPLPIELAIPIGLIVNELVINAFKHAFPADRQGRISVSLHRRDTSTVALEVRDDGVGLPDEVKLVKATSMGLSLVRDLVQQIGGTVTYSQVEGSTFVVTVTA